MIPAPPRSSAPPPASPGPRPRPFPRREASPEAYRPQLAPRLTTQTSPTLPYATRDSPQRPHPRSRPASPTRRRVPPPAPATGSRPAPACASSPRAMSVDCRAPSTMPASHPPHYAHLSPLTPQPDGYLSLEQFNECGVLPHRLGRAPHSLKVSSRGGVAPEVSGGREDDATGGTGQGAGLSSGAPVARHRVEHAAEWVGRRL
jgi:hypothetical protein